MTWKAALERGWSADERYLAVMIILQDYDRTKPPRYTDYSYYRTRFEYGQLLRRGFIGPFGAYSTPISVGIDLAFAAVNRGSQEERPPFEIALSRTGFKARLALTDKWSLENHSKRSMAIQEMLLTAIFGSGPLSLPWLPVAGADRPWYCYYAGRIIEDATVAEELSQLLELGLIQYVDGTYRMTKAGRASFIAYQGSLSEYLKARVSPVSEHSKFVFNAPVGNVVGEANDSTIINADLGSSAELHNLIETLSALLPAIKLDAEAAAESEAALAEVAKEAQTANPDKGALRQLLGRIRAAISKAQGPLTDVAVGVIDAQIKQLTQGS